MLLSALHTLHLSVFSHPFCKNLSKRPVRQQLPMLSHPASRCQFRITLIHARVASFERPLPPCRQNHRRSRTRRLATRRVQVVSPKLSHSVLLRRVSPWGSIAAGILCDRKQKGLRPPSRTSCRPATGTAPGPRQPSTLKASVFAPLAETQHKSSRFSPRLGKRNPRPRLYTTGPGVASRLISIPGSPSTVEVMLCTHGFGRARHFNSWSRCVSRVGG